MYKFTFHYELIITRFKRYVHRVLSIYISLWTNYNRMGSNINSKTIERFTFHYELIITENFYGEDERYINIYISLWTNYNCKWAKSQILLAPFTFHYELIITKQYSELLMDIYEFTFHYELIITWWSV